MDLKTVLIAVFSMSSLCSSYGALIVNGDMSSNSYATGGNHVEWVDLNAGWAVKDKDNLDFDTNPGKITWAGPDYNLLTDALAQVNQVTTEVGSSLTLEFEWIAASGASSTNVSIEYQVIGWKESGSPASGYFFKDINGEDRTVDNLDGTASWIDLLDGSVSSSEGNASHETFDGVAGSNMSASITIDLSNYGPGFNDVSDYDYIGIRFWIAGENGDLSAIGSTLDNVQLIPSNVPLAVDDERNFYTDYIGLVDQTVDLVADYGLAWDPVNGADGSDTANDTIALQAAIDDMTLLPNGGKVTIPAGTFYLDTVLMKSNVHLEIDSGATLVAASEGIMFRMGLAAKGADALTTITNTSIRGVGGRYTVDGSWIAPSNKFSFVICNNVDNFMVSDFYMIDNYTVFSAIMTSMATHDDQYFVARNGVMKNCHMINAHFGYGMVQAWAGHNMLYKDLSGVGGITLRCETGLNSLMTAPDYVNLDNAYGRNISVTNGHGGVMLGAHGRPNGHVDVDGVVAVSTLFAAAVGDGYGSSHEDITTENYGFSPTTVIRNVHAVYGPDAQLKSKNFKDVPCPLKHLISPTAFPHDPIIFPGPAAYVAKTQDPEIEILNVTAEGFDYVSHLVYGDVPYRTLSISPAEPVTGLTVSPASVSLQVSKTAQVVGNVIPAGATHQGVNWSTSDPTVATVSESGEIMAVGAGTCEITGLSVDWGWPGTCTVTVVGGGGGSWTELSNNDFEAGWGAWESGGANAFLTTNEYAIGTYCVQLQDDTATSHMVLSNALDLTSYHYLKLQFSMVGDNADDGESVVVEFSDDGGSTWSPAKSYLYDYEFDDEHREDLELVLDKNQFNFTSNAKVRIRSNVNSASETFYIDNVVISGFAQSGWGEAVAAYGLSGIATNDSDHDGKSDLYEFALGGNPTNNADTGMAPSITYHPDHNVSLQHLELDDSNSGIQYQCEWTDNLVNGVWTNTWESTTNVASGMSGYNQADHTIYGGTNDQLFLRLIITQP